MYYDGKTVLIAGGNSAIAKALARSLTVQGANVLALSRKEIQEFDSYAVDLTKSESVNDVQAFLYNGAYEIDLVINCVGLLHDQEHMPERQLKEIKADWLLKSMEVNLVTHIHLAQALEPCVKKKKELVFASLSAMVGSIRDNGLGGWYSYRMSKAALNMFIKGLSIEWKRYNAQNRVLAIHPGTTDSQMSKPFKVRPDKLYSPELTATRILSVLEKSDQQETGSFLNWNGEVIPY